ncbi:uncharacterized protein A1O5_01781 [Cladophialophora psammophila CBS 110553]|uniref:Uncharacterized protein n=1 Tax=Cladophialophora psammophila CBS 110553 TaxID=1182543 RepID=W9XCP1_9EURO|nr:uncharacterized protein A1O5_01781 [Cladophialophora psammophila CBS 110553]EXJ75085.1 hypothetical protein A1O5_01781 [Cladophialophora psammophila CBS 110553]
MGYFYNCRVRDDAGQVRRPTGYERVDISFNRTVRVPDNSGKSSLPPNLEVVARGGMFLPIAGSIWINFTVNSPFTIKVYPGSVNAFAGEPAAEEFFTKQRRQVLRSQGKIIQEYIIFPGSRWLDGIASSSGVVKQFVATRLGEVCTVEAQITSHETSGGLQIEITPAVVSPSTQIRVRVVPWNKTIHLGVPSDSNLRYIADMVYRLAGIKIEIQRVFYQGQEMLPSGHRPPI